MNPIPTFRHETPEDIAGIREVIHDAFGRPGEADLVDALRRAKALTVSAVAEQGSRIVGHMAFSPVTIGDRHAALALAPLAVRPECQNQGIGAQLVRWGLEECRALGHGIVIVLGAAAYYGRFGFTPCASFGVESPFPVRRAENFQLLELSPGAVAGYSGMVRYRPEFELV